MQDPETTKKEKGGIHLRTSEEDLQGTPRPVYTSCAEASLGSSHGLGWRSRLDSNYDFQCIE